MNKQLLFNLLCATAVIIAGAGTAMAFPANKYATTSVLATGKWVKIAIPEDGMYQISFNELREMGFQNPEKVAIYGTGGHLISEILDGRASDDLKQVPSKLFENKICFYACGPVEYSIATPATNPHFTRGVNNCSTLGYYFLTESEGNPLRPSSVTYGITGNKVRDTSLDYFLHEQEVVSMSQSGKEFLGEKISNGEITIPYSLPNLVADSAIIVNPRAAVKSKNTSYVTLKVNGQDIEINQQDAKIFSSSSEYVYYNTAQPVVKVNPGNGNTLPASGDITVGIEAAVAFSWAKLDYCMITYYHTNTLQGSQDGQMRMGFNNVSRNDIISVVDPTASTQLWNIDEPHSPKNYTLSEKNGVKGFTPLYTIDYTQFIAFDPALELKKIAGYEKIDNQDIHAMSVPNMVIVTCDTLYDQAQRIAQMHRDNDNMVVHVLDQQKIFNEFSSGTPDAMGIRLMSKMFYDRNKNKYKNLLMFGAGNYDNRQLHAKRECTILTYEATVSNDEEYSYVCDDFFGILDDNSGIELAKDYLRLGVGRIPCATIQEAESDVDKLINYVNNPDYGSWRNDVVLTADEYDNGLHAFQTEGINNIIVTVNARRTGS